MTSAFVGAPVGAPAGLTLGVVAALVAATVVLLLRAGGPEARVWSRPTSPRAPAGGESVRGPEGSATLRARVAAAWAARRSGTGSSAAGGSSQGETEALLAFLDVLAPSLRAGRAPEEAARLACRVVQGGPLVDDIRDALEHGRSVDTVLVRHARTHADVRLFARAWELSALTGCPLADTVACVARLVRAKLAHRRRVETASTGARASIRILTLLPLGGPVLGLAVGVDPVTAYVTSPTAWGCLAVGLLLVLLGRAWVERLVAAVARGPVLGEPT